MRGVDNVKDMNHMFYKTSSLKSIDLSSFNTNNVNDMNNIFSACLFLKSIDLSSFNTSNIKDMNHMFLSCSSLVKDNIEFLNNGKNENIDKINKFRELYQLKKDDYTDEKLLKILKENYFNI